MAYDHTASASAHPRDTRNLESTAQAADSAKLAGYSQSVTNTANTMTRRDGSGDVVARLFRSTYSTHGGTPPADAAFAFRISTTNNYIRFCGASEFKTWLDNMGVSSDRRLKQNIEPLTNALHIVSNMQGVYYNMIAYPDRDDIGFIAQDVEEVLPEVVFTDSEGMKSLDYGKITAVLANAVNEQPAIVNSLEERIARLEKLVL